MRVLGLDLGNNTLGVAISDMLGIIASPIGVKRFDNQDLNKALEYTIEIIKEHQIGKIVLGYPINMNGTIGPQANYCLEFKKMLEDNTKLEVIMMDERLTSRQVDVVMISADLSRKKRKQNSDKLAASIILQTYLDRL